MEKLKEQIKNLPGSKRRFFIFEIFDSGHIDLKTKNLLVKYAAELATTENADKISTLEKFAEVLFQDLKN